MFATYEVPGTNTRSHPVASSSARRPSAVSDADISVRTEVLHALEEPGTFPLEGNPRAGTGCTRSSARLLMRSGFLPLDGEFSADRGRPVGKVTTPSD
jgi:hypothetical protein